MGIGARLNCPLVSFWERRLSEAKTERENREKALSVTFGDSSPRGRAKGCTLFYFSPLSLGEAVERSEDGEGKQGKSPLSHLR